MIGFIDYYSHTHIPTHVTALFPETFKLCGLHMQKQGHKSNQKQTKIN